MSILRDGHVALSILGVKDQDPHHDHHDHSPADQLTVKP